MIERCPNLPQMTLSAFFFLFRGKRLDEYREIKRDPGQALSMVTIPVTMMTIGNIDAGRMVG